MANLTSEELQQVEILSDPVKWAYVYLGWEARWYQEEILRDNSLHIVLRMGRRTGKTTTIMVLALYRCFTRPDYEVLIVTPYESQIREMDAIITRFIADCPELEASIKSKTKNPFRIEFKNGSVIKGFTAGTKAGNQGASIRGQRADLIVLDEVDYMDEGEIVAVTAIALEAPERISIIAMSTPSGRREFFYKICTDPKSSYRQFHYPSSVNPEWTPEAEADFRLLHSDIDYQHEILAEFGDEASGVFNKEAVDIAANTVYYAYALLTPSQGKWVKENNIEVVRLGPYTANYKPPKAIRTMGVDWDKAQATPQIVVTEYNQEFNKLQVVYHEDIPKTDLTLDFAVQRIIALNEIYDPAFIYVDRGFGEYQVETLHAYGLKHPESGLRTKVKGWHFGQHIDVLDPVTKQVEAKPLKHFMVNQAALFFERQKILISLFDEVLYRQIINYSVVRVSQSGQPVYTSKDEHALDALMLSTLAFVLEFPDLSPLHSAELAHKFSVVSKAAVRSGPQLETKELEVDRPRWRPRRSMGAVSWGPRSQGRRSPIRRRHF